MFCVCWVGDVIMVIPWFMSIRHRNFPFLIKKCSMLMVKPSAFDVSEQSYGTFGRIYSLNYLQNNLKIMEFNFNGALIDFYQARV